VVSLLLSLINSAAAVDTQAEYDALIGHQVLVDVSSGGVQSILTTSDEPNGLVIEKIDIRDYPGKIAFGFECGFAVVFFLYT